MAAASLAAKPFKLRHPRQLSSSHQNLEHRLPTLYESSATAGEGGLMWYGQVRDRGLRRPGRVVRHQVP
jgi:hypothetical protein